MSQSWDPLLKALEVAAKTKSSQRFRRRRRPGSGGEPLLSRAATERMARKLIPAIQRDLIAG
jgi:hypothetical protein